MSFLDNYDEKILPTEEPEIFGRSKSREEIKAERKAQRAKELAALRDARRAARVAKKAAAEGKKDMLIMGAILLAVLIGGGLWIGISIAQDNRLASYEPSETNTGYFNDEDAKPTLSKDGINAEVNEVYYTVGGHLCVAMTLGNGTDKPMSLDSLEVAIYNAEDALVASGFTEAISKTYRIDAGGYNTYTLYIKPEHVKITNDTLQTITYEITAVGTMED